MNGKIRLTQTTVKVLVALLSRKGERVYGYEILKETGLKSGSLYPILSRLEQHLWLNSDWADPDESHPQRPRRRYYQLTSLGEEKAWQALKELQAEFAPILGRLHRTEASA